MSETVGYSYERVGWGYAGYVEFHDEEIGTSLGPYFAATEAGIRRKLERKARRAKRNQGTRIEVESV